MVNVHECNFSTFKNIQGHILGQGHVKVKQINQNVCSVIYHNYVMYKID